MGRLGRFSTPLVLALIWTLALPAMAADRQPVVELLGLALDELPIALFDEAVQVGQQHDSDRAGARVLSGQRRPSGSEEPGPTAGPGVAPRRSLSS